MKKGLLFILVGLACGMLMTSCGPQKWVHKEDPTFSFNIPINTAADKKRADSEVVRLGGTENAYRLPTYAASVFDKPAGLTLENSGQFAIDDFQKVYPDASRFTILEQKNVKLSDGSDAKAVKFKWRWTDMVTTLKTASVVAIKGDKVIHLSGTTIFAGGTPMDELMANVMTLQLQ